jgi:hypothetical protein
MHTFDSDKAFAIYAALIKAYYAHSLNHKLPLKPDCYEDFAKEAIHAAMVFEATCNDTFQEMYGVKK